jgi:hypothetical protein
MWLLYVHCFLSLSSILFIPLMHSGVSFHRSCLFYSLPLTSTHIVSPSPLDSLWPIERTISHKSNNVQHWDVLSLFEASNCPESAQEFECPPCWWDTPATKPERQMHMSQALAERLSPHGWGRICTGYIHLNNVSLRITPSNESSIY